MSQVMGSHLGLLGWGAAVQVGMAVAVMRGVADEECIDLALAAGRDCNIPMAPALGLYLVRILNVSRPSRGPFVSPSTKCVGKCPSASNL